MTYKYPNPSQNLAYARGKPYGFTLIELMIVVVVLGIIAALAFPAYTSQVQKARRADAISALLGVAQQLERCYTRTSSYENCLTFPIDSDNDHYTLNIVNGSLSQTTYTLIARPNAPQNNDLCTQFTLTHRGIRDAQPSRDECWRR